MSFVDRSNNPSALKDYLKFVSVVYISFVHITPAGDLEWWSLFDLPFHLIVLNLENFFASTPFTKYVGMFVNVLCKFM